MRMSVLDALMQMPLVNPCCYEISICYKTEILPSSNSVIRLSGQCHLPDTLLINYLRDAAQSLEAAKLRIIVDLSSLDAPLSLFLSLKTSSPVCMAASDHLN